jgi:hypothetical protein
MSKPFGSLEKGKGGNKGGRKKKKETKTMKIRAKGRRKNKEI